jgi:hypothetical protein
VASVFSIFFFLHLLLLLLGVIYDKFMVLCCGLPGTSSQGGTGPETRQGSLAACDRMLDKANDSF